MNETVNVRSGPGTEFDVLGQHYAGQWVPATGKNAEPATWWQVVYEAAPDKRGWVSGQFVTPNDEALKLPVVWGTVTPPAPTVPATSTSRPAATGTAPASTRPPSGTTPDSPTLPPETSAPVATTAGASAPAVPPASATAPSPAGAGGGGSLGDIILPVGLVLLVIGVVLWRLRK